MRQSRPTDQGPGGRDLRPAADPAQQSVRGRAAGQPVSSLSGGEDLRRVPERSGSGRAPRRRPEGRCADVKKKEDCN